MGHKPRHSDTRCPILEGWSSLAGGGRRLRRQALTGRPPLGSGHRHRTPEGCQKRTAFRHDLSVLRRDPIWPGALFTRLAIVGDSTPCFAPALLLPSLPGWYPVAPFPEVCALLRPPAKFYLPSGKNWHPVRGIVGES